MDDQTNTSGPGNFSDVLDDWIAGATLATKSIDIYGQPALQAEYEKLVRDLEVAKAVAKDAEVSQSESSEVSLIEEQLVELYEKWMASKSTWTVRALPTEIAAELGQEHPEQKQPAELEPDASEQTQRLHAVAVAAWKQTNDARNFAILENVVVKIEWADGRVIEPKYAGDGVRFDKPAITVEQLEKMRSRLGEVQYMRLMSASTLASLQEPVVPAPFSRSSSENEKT